MASIEQRGGAWRVVWRLDGRKQSTTWDDQETAERAAAVAKAHRHQVDAEWVYCHVAGVAPVAAEPDAGPTLRDWAQTWLAAKTRITPGVLATYRRQMDNQILPALGDRPVAEITPSEIGAFLNALRGGTIQRSTTVTRYYSLLRGVFKAAVAEGLRTDNPAAKTDFVRDQVDHDDTGEPTQIRLTPTEFTALRAAFGDHDRPMIDLLVGTGARWSEAAAIAVQHFAAGDKPTVKIWRAWKWRPGGPYLGTTKGRSKREVGITAALATTLAAAAEDQPDDGLLMRAPEGGPLIYGSWHSRVWEPAVVRAMRCPTHPPARRATPGQFSGLCGDHGGMRNDGKPCGFKAADGLDRCRWHAGPARDAVSTCSCPGVLRRRPTPHDLRHTHAAWLFSNPAVTPLAISRRLGHAQLSTTSELYGDLMPEAQQATVDAIASALGE